MTSFIGIDLGGTSVKGGRFTSGRLEDSAISNIPHNESTQDSFDRICDLVDTLWNMNVLGIGIGVPALIDFETGTPYGFSNIKQLNGFPIQSALQDKYKVPVLLQNDANCFVLGERYFGNAQEYKNIVGLITGTGVGAGIMINDSLYNGANMGAGEFGMIPYKDDCFESYCSGKFFADKYQMAGEKLYDQASAGDENALTIFNEYGKHLGELIKLICYSYDPEIIIIGGSVVNAFDYYKSAMEETLQSFYFKSKLKVDIVPSQIKDIALYGAVGMFLEKGMSNNGSLIK